MGTNLNVLTLTKNEGQYTVMLSPKNNELQITYSFSQDFLSEKTIRHVRSLSMFSERTDSTYLLDTKQNEVFREVLRKLINEEQSGYLFSVHLQKNHLIELIHLITKIHLAKPVEHSSN